VRRPYYNNTNARLASASAAAATAAAARADKVAAETSGKLDKVLHAVQSMQRGVKSANEYMDRTAERMDGFERRERNRRDAARARADAVDDYLWWGREADWAAIRGDAERLLECHGERKALRKKYPKHGDLPARRTDGQTNTVVSVNPPLVEVSYPTPYTDRKLREFYGSPLAWMAEFMQPAQAVTSFASYPKNARGEPWPPK
jgi:hypothetical protein